MILLTAASKLYSITEDKTKMLLLEYTRWLLQERSKNASLQDARIDSNLFSRNLCFYPVSLSALFCYKDTWPGLSLLLYFSLHRTNPFGRIDVALNWSCIKLRNKALCKCGSSGALFLPCSFDSRLHILVSPEDAKRTTLGRKRRQRGTICTRKKAS